MADESFVLMWIGLVDGAESAERSCWDVPG